MTIPVSRLARSAHFWWVATVWTWNTRSIKGCTPQLVSE